MEKGVAMVSLRPDFVDTLPEIAPSSFSFVDTKYPSLSLPTTLDLVNDMVKRFISDKCWITHVPYAVAASRQQLI